MQDEWTRSRSMLEDVIGAPVVTASIPGGFGNELTYRTAAEAGYEVLFTSEPHLLSRRIEGMLCVGRICPKRGTSLSRVAAFAQGQGLEREQVIRMAKNTVHAFLNAVPSWRGAEGATSPAGIR
jgi:hypothetical protein